MIPLKQRYRHDPENGIWGDCHRAAIASVLEMNLDDVPHFGDGGPTVGEFLRREKKFLLKQDIIPILVAFHATEEGLSGHLRMMGICYPNITCLLGGRSRSGVNHTVVTRGGEIVHDPSLINSGIVGPCDDGHFWVTFFGHKVGS